MIQCALKSTNTRLSSGAHLSFAKTKTSSSHVAVSLPAGPVFENEETWGLTHFLEHMVFRGAGRFKDSRGVALFVDELGGDLGAATYRDRVVFDTRCDPGREAEALEVISAMLFRPRFEGLETEKEIVREELLEFLDDDGAEIDPDNLGFSRLFNGQALGRSIDGTLDGLERFSLDDVREFHGAIMRPERAFVAVAGPVSRRSVQEAADAMLAPTSKARAIVPKAPRRRRVKRVVHRVRGADSQTQVRLMFKVPGARAPEVPALNLLRRILDDGPASRLQARLVDRDGLAYSLWCGLDLYEDAGVFEIGAQVAHDRAFDLVLAIADELAELKERAPSAAERRRAVQRYARDLRDLQDRPGRTAEILTRVAQLHLPFSPNAWSSSLAAVSASQIKQMARRTFRMEQLSCILVGGVTRDEANALEVDLGEALRE